ncbi:polysaccharide export protein [Aliishimia ponticola]|uniref:Polysaccharide export protein n=1 Tax=Aliishimia ponticola TaxID=2499833 RepID=A0A4S4NP84_9RHOB|nr:polysaccharide biosynthesis/export family protein [Aliishimia ponticola]THH38040.1 polysaccharide export protein [Aliishimia ponticola]
MRLGPRILWSVTLVLGLAACSLPRGAALQSEILSDRKAEAESAAEFAVHKVDKAFLDRLESWPSTGPHRRWLAHSHSRATDLIAPGDTVNVQIWDSSENSILTSEGERVADIRGVKVSPQGMVFLPYIGRIRIAGMTEEAARNRIQRETEKAAPLAQVILTVETGVKRSADLVGGVSAPGSYDIPDSHFTLLNLISAGGGVSESLRNPQVSLIRRGTRYTTSLDTVYQKPDADVVIAGGDKVIIEQDDRYFRALGATGGDALHYFPSENLTALDALALIGGLEASRADPKGILIFREYDADKVGGSGPEQARTVFVIDLTSADGTFSAGKFDIAPKDTVLVTESPVTNARTIFGLIGSAFGLVSTVNNNT